MFSEGAKAPDETGRESGHMARIVGRRRIREGRSVGERLTEIIVYVLIIGGLVWGVRWYFAVYLQSPKVALGRYLGLVKAGDVKGQFEMLSARSKAYFGDARQYEDKWPASQDLAGRVASWEFNKVQEEGDRAQIDAVVNIRRAGQELYQASSDPYSDRYVLVREADGWKIALDQSTLKSVEAARSRR